MLAAGASLTPAAYSWYYKSTSDLQHLNVFVYVGAQIIIFR